MIKKLIIIIGIISIYIYLISSDHNGDVLNRTKKLYSYCLTKYKKMNLKYYINKWPDKKKRRNKYY